jgi:8-oxo-dGTP diphosphatase
MINENEFFLAKLLEQASVDKVDKIVVGAVIRNKLGKVLLLQRAASEDFLPNVWELPSGHVDEGEGLIQALKREIFEETGYQEIEVTAYLDSFDYKSRSGKLVRQFNFVVTSPGVNPQLNPAEHQAYKFCDLQEAHGLRADETVLRRFAALG